MRCRLATFLTFGAAVESYDWVHRGGNLTFYDSFQAFSKYVPGLRPHRTKGFIWWTSDTDAPPCVRVFAWDHSDTPGTEMLEAMFINQLGFGYDI